MKYNHAVTVAFTVISNDRAGQDFTPAMLKAALLARIANLDAEETWVEAVGPPYDTYEDG